MQSEYRKGLVDDLFVKKYRAQNLEKLRTDLVC